MDLRQLAWNLAMQSPVHKGFLDSVQETDEFERSDFQTSDSADCLALGVALAWDGIAISLPSEEVWRLTEIPISQHLYDSNLEKFSVVRHRVRNASIPDHVDWVIDDWRRSASAKVNEVAQLVDNWELLFPWLDLCKEHQRKTLPALGDQATLGSVTDRLCALNVACKRWVDGSEGSPEYGFRARPESPETMGKKERARQRLATCPRRGEAYFIMHCNIQPKGFRLYWLENEEDHRLCIGYVGPHLETTRHKAQ